MKTSIIVNLRIEGIHAWYDCPIEEVRFLTTLHRHIFNIKCKKNVTHDERDVEIIQFKRKIQNFLFERYPYKLENNNLVPSVCFFNGMSCETIAKRIAEQFDLSYCEVLEDGENGAIVEK